MTVITVQDNVELTTSPDRRIDRSRLKSQDKPTYVIREIRESPALAAPAREYHRA